MRAGATSLILVCALCGCSGAAPTAFQRNARAAERAYAAGRYAEAAAAWERAANGASTGHDRDEALYRRATSLLRAGRREEARLALEGLLRESPRGPRAARAAHDRIALTCEGDAVDCRGALAEFLRRHPASGLARPALRRLVASFGEGEGHLLRSILEALGGPLQGTPISEDLAHALAHSLARDGHLERALARFLAAAEAHPYPRGALWDDALWYAAEMELRLGRPRLAVAHLDRMLAAREPALGNGSYERPRYGEARFRIAEIWRDVLGDGRRAQATFDRLYREHPTSRLRDEALYGAALIAHESGDEPGACQRVEALVRELPASRYAPCARRVCRTAPALEARTCSPYVTRAPPRRGIPGRARAGPEDGDKDEED